MPFQKFDVSASISKLYKEDNRFRKAWDASAEEYRVLGELMALRKKSGLTQKDLATRSGLKQQAVSRLESREASPTLRTLCKVLDTLGYEIKLVPKLEGA